MTRAGACAALLIGLLVGGATVRADEMVVDVLWIEGMTLRDCDEVGMKLLLESLPGVAGVTIEFDSGRAEVARDPQRVGRDEVISEINNRGFEVPWVTDTFVVGWNLARRDAPAVRLLLGTLDGVAEVEVDEATARAAVRYDPAVVGRDALVGEMGNLGWDMTLVHPDAAPGQ